MRRLLPILLCCLPLALFAGCGNKGPLVLPPKQPPAAPAASPAHASTVPAPTAGH